MAPPRPLSAQPYRSNPLLWGEAARTWTPILASRPHSTWSMASCAPLQVGDHDRPSVPVGHVEHAADGLRLLRNGGLEPRDIAACQRVMSAGGHHAERV